MCMFMYQPGGTGKPNEPVQSAAFLQMEMFMVSMRRPDTGLRFASHETDPYSEELHGALESWRRSGGIVEDRDGRLRLSDKGMEMARRAWDVADDPVRKVMSAMKMQMNDMTEREAVAYTYSQHPEFAEKSKRYGEYEEFRVEAARSLYQKDKASIRLSVQISGMGHQEFVDMMAGMGINVYQPGPDGMMQIARIRNISNKLYKRLTKLDPGERGLIWAILMLEDNIHEKRMILTDDKKARSVIRGRGIEASDSFAFLQYCNNRAAMTRDEAMRAYDELWRVMGRGRPDPAHRAEFASKLS